MRPSPDPTRSFRPAPDPMPDRKIFLQTWLKQPLRTGAVAPSGQALANLITSEIRADGGPVVELGPGTGVFTRSLLDRGLPESQLILVESNPDFAALLRRRHPRAQMLEMDVRRLRRLAGPWDGLQAQAVISGLPLLNMGLRAQWGVLSACTRCLRAGAAIYQFTYLARCPIAPAVLARLNLRSEPIGRTLRNLPPAAVYRITPA